MHIKHGAAVLQSPVTEVPTSRGSMKTTTFSLCGPYGKPLIVDVILLGKAMDGLPLNTAQGSGLSFEGTLETRLVRGQNRPRLLVTAVLGITAPGGEKSAASSETAGTGFTPGWDSPPDKTG